MAEWKNPGPPAFKGAGKKDPVVDAWLDDIKAKCTERKIPKDFWHLVGQRSLGSRAKARFNEVDQVMLKMHDGKYKWNWKRFKVAMKNMGCKWNPLFFSASCRYLSFWLTGWRFFFDRRGHGSKESRSLQSRRQTFRRVVDYRQGEVRQRIDSRFLPQSQTRRTQASSNHRFETPSPYTDSSCHHTRRSCHPQASWICDVCDFRFDNTPPR